MSGALSPAAGQGGAPVSGAPVGAKGDADVRAAAVPVVGGAVSVAGGAVPAAQPALALPGSEGLPAQLAPLREDLQLHRAAADADGSPAWMIQDPISNTFYRLGWLEFELLIRWHLAEPAAILAALERETLLSASEEELEDFYRFLRQSQLLEIHDLSYTRELIKRHRDASRNKLKLVLHHYLFFRVPMVKPDQTLRRWLPAVQWIYTRTTAITLVLLTLLGLVLTARQWDVFLASFRETLSPEGLVGYLLAIAVAKSLHELGHAFTATRYGLRVSHMGVAFIVLWPMLYTDTGEAWRLPQQRRRLAIDAAGIITELAIAGLATLAWNLAGDGDIKQALFYLATTSWVLTLGLNASPFMRFDGYFILSDALDIPNLHERSFAFARAALRRTLFGWDEPDPEPVSTARRRGLILFAWLTWIYRLILFIGIAIAVYLFFFKLLGILLFIVEIAWFIARPVWNEVKVWRARWGETRRSRKLWLTAAIGGLLLLALAPLPYPIRAAAVAQPAASHVFYSPLPARVAELPAATPTGARAVAEGEAVFVLDEPEVQHRGALAQVQVETLQARLRGLAGADDGEALRAELERLREMQQAEWLAQRDESERLRLRAPFAGVLTDIDPRLAPGVWVAQRDPLAVLVDPASWEVAAFVGQDEIARVQPGARVRFFADIDPLRPLLGHVVAVDSARTKALPYELLSTEHGGRIPVILGGEEPLTPRDALYRVRIALDAPAPQLHLLGGRVAIAGAPESWLLEFLKPVAIVAIREFGF